MNCKIRKKYDIHICTSRPADTQTDKQTNTQNEIEFKGKATLPIPCRSPIKMQN